MNRLHKNILLILMSSWTTSIIAISPPTSDYAPTSGKIESFALNSTSCFISILPTGAQFPITLRADRKTCRDELKGMQVKLTYAYLPNPDCENKSPCKFQRTIRMIYEIKPAVAHKTRGANSLSANFQIATLTNQLKFEVTV